MSSVEKAIQRIRYAYENHPAYLSLSGLRLRALPEEIKELKDLYELDLAHNCFTEVPREIANFRKLRILDLSYNCLNSCVGIGTDYIAYDQFYSVSFRNNNFRYVIDEFYLLVKSEDESSSIDFYGNDFYVEPPNYIYQDGLAAVLYYAKYVEENKHESIMSEAKLVVVGQGEVGKTSLIKRLSDEDMEVLPDSVETTRGIDIIHWEIPTYLYEEDLPEAIRYGFVDLDHQSVSLDSSGQMYYDTLVHIWDFGGQEIYYNMHQVFLTKKAFYLLVWDARKEETLENFDYWINTISTLGQGSPLAIVMNKSDVRTRHLDEKILRSKFRNIRFFAQTSCTTGEGIDELRELLYDELMLLPTVGERVPNTYIKVKTLLSVKDDDYILFEDFIEIYESVDRIRFKLVDKARLLLKHFTEVGSIIYHDRDQILEDIVVLNPEWITKAFYRLIDDQEIQKNNGRFDYKVLSRLWTSDAYPRDKHLHILRYLEVNELAFNLLGTQDYIIPDLLPHDSKDDEVSIDRTQVSRFEYRFSFLPKGVIPRFICRNHIMIHSDKYWRFGVVLNYRGAYATIEEDRYERSIKVSVRGEKRVNLLSIIRNEFENIFSILEIERHLDYREFIPCICTACIHGEPYFFDIRTLEKYLEKSKESIVCQKSIEDVNIWEAVNGYKKLKSRPPVFLNLLKACSTLQGNHMIVSSHEDSRNKFIATILKSSGLIASDQPRWGKSATGKSQGEIDVMLETDREGVVGIFEGFNLKGLDTAKIQLHYQKIFGYDPNGLRENYMVVYNDSKDFLGLWEKYQEVISNTTISYEVTEPFLDVSMQYSHGSELKVGKTKFVRNSEIGTIFHVFLNLNYSE